MCLRARQDGTAARVRFRSTGEHRPELDEAAATTLFRVAQGLLANVREHARATSLLVTLHHCADRVDLDVCDDGVSASTSPASPARPRRTAGSASRPPGRDFGSTAAISPSTARGPGHPESGHRARPDPSAAVLAESPVAAVR
ncbi:hypothetical protein [Streptomyces canus]|uniref:hypothetical protein n=1 Tax=Streptomyces canus TaxID=58343 RepID=UPI0003A9EFE3|nr:hypothetical protein [Streptomyces canus]